MRRLAILIVPIVLPLMSELLPIGTCTAADGAVREIAEGGAVMSPEVAIRVVELFRKTQAPEQSSTGLSPQELRLLKLRTEGHQNRTAA